MNKGFTEPELEQFFSVIDDPKFSLMFSYQAVLGLRVGEAVRINIKDINLRTKELRIDTEKSGKVDYLLIPNDLFERTINYASAYEDEIGSARGFIFFSFAPGRRTSDTKQYLTSHSVRLAFREYVRKAKLEEIYAHALSPCPRPLYRLTPHSLRHYAITNFCKKNGGNVALSSKFARHTNLQTTMIYIHTKKEELYQGIEKSNDPNLLMRVKEMQEKIDKKINGT